MTLYVESTKQTDKSPNLGDFALSDVAFGGPLGKDANIVGSDFSVSRKNSRSVARLKLLDAARTILARYDVRSKRTGNRHRTRNCHAVPAHQKDIYITLNNDSDTSSAGITGVQTCGSICSCPVCATNKMIEYGQEIRKVLKYAELHNLRPVLMTLTAQHDRDMSLEYFQTRFAEAWRKWQQNRSYRRLKDDLKIAHQVAAREITHGKNGWHYHMHVLLLVPPSSVHHASNATEQRYSFTLSWLNALDKVGLTASMEHAFDLSTYGSNETYIAKLGYEIDDSGDLAYELTGNANKGMTVFDFLNLARYGDLKYEKLYLEYVDAMQGFNWITFSHGLKDLIQDIELDETPLPANQVLHKWYKVDPHDWYAIARMNRVHELVIAAARWRDKRRLEKFIRKISREYWQFADLLH